MTNNGAFLADYYRMTGRKCQFSIPFLVDIIFRHNVRFMYWVRRRASGGGIFCRFKLYRYSRKYGLEVSPTAVIGRGLCLIHPYNISIGDGVVLGENVCLHKGSTIGVEYRGKRVGSPILGNRIYVGINATVVGKIVIGDDVLIAPGAFVNFDVPSHSIVLGNPGKIHFCEDATGGYIFNCI